MDVPEDEVVQAALRTGRKEPEEELRAGESTGRGEAGS